jgi:hypothetical protein
VSRYLGAAVSVLVLSTLVAVMWPREEIAMRFTARGHNLAVYDDHVAIRIIATVVGIIVAMAIIALGKSRSHSG